MKLVFIVWFCQKFMWLMFVWVDCCYTNKWEIITLLRETALLTMWSLALPLHLVKPCCSLWQSLPTRLLVCCCLCDYVYKKKLIIEKMQSVLNMWAHPPLSLKWYSSETNKKLDLNVNSFPINCRSTKSLANRNAPSVIDTERLFQTPKSCFIL